MDIKDYTWNHVFYCHLLSYDADSLSDVASHFAIAEDDIAIPTSTIVH
jgi:hypothetical protein